VKFKVEIELQDWHRDAALAARLSAAPQLFSEVPQRGDIVCITEASGNRVDLVVVQRMCTPGSRGETWRLLCRV